ARDRADPPGTVARDGVLDEGHAFAVRRDAQALDEPRRAVDRVVEGNLDDAAAQHGQLAARQEVGLADTVGDVAWRAARKRHARQRPAAQHAELAVAA